MSALRNLTGHTAIGPNYWWLVPSALLAFGSGGLTLWMFTIAGLNASIYAFFVFLLLFAPNAAILFLHPIRIRLDHDGKEIVLVYLVRRTVRIQLDSIYGFSAAHHTMLRSSRKIRVLYHLGRKHTELSEITLRSIDTLEGFLQRGGIQYLGMESSFFPFRKFTYRFDSK